MKNNFFIQHKHEIETFNSGDNYHIYKFLGAHLRDDGADFAVWAPNAQEVSVCGDFNDWDSERNKMELYDGIWHTFVSGVTEGDIYKFSIKRNNISVLKSDPLAFCSQLRPATGSVISSVATAFSESTVNVKKTNKELYNSPINIYEVHLGSLFMRENGEFYNYREIAQKLTSYLVEMSYNYVEIMPLCEYPLDASWGYQITGYFSLTSRYGTWEDFKCFVDTLHEAGIGVILDWVPGHFCRDMHGLIEFDGGPLYESENQKKADNPGWGTLNFDFSKPQVVSFLISNAVFWMEAYGIDGIRVDAVANMLYNTFGKNESRELLNKNGGYENLEGIEFIKRMNKTVHELFPACIMAAEDSSSWPLVTGDIENGGLGFDFKWNMGWMNDTLSYMKLDPIYRKGVHDKLTFGMFYAFSEHFILPLSHDEVVHGKCSMVEKMPGYRVDKYAQLRTYYTYMYGMPGKKLMFMGNEFGHSLEWRFYEQLEWNLLQYEEYAGVKTCVSDINYLYMKNKALWEEDTSWEGFSWSNANDSEKSIVSFIRYSKEKKDMLVFICNFTPVKYEHYPVGISKFSDYREIFNSDNLRYGGANILNRGVIPPKCVSVGEMPFSVNITLPPFGAVILKPLIN